MFFNKGLNNFKCDMKIYNKIKRNISQSDYNKYAKITNSDNMKLYFGDRKTPLVNKINKFDFSTKFNNKDDILPDHLFYDIPKYTKNPENVDFPWLIGGAPFLELKVYCKKTINFKKLL